MAESAKLESYLDLKLQNGEWHRRWFVLTQDRRLCFFKTSQAIESRGQIELDSIRGCLFREASPGHAFVFSMELEDDNYICVSAATEKIRTTWMNALSSEPIPSNVFPAIPANIRTQEYPKAGSSEKVYESSLQKIIVSNEHNAPINGSQILQTGWLKKRSETFRRWKPRFFVLQDRTLTYYEDESQTKPKGTISLELVHKMKPVDTKKYGQANCFELVSATTIYAISAETPQERDTWMAKIEESPIGARSEKQKRLSRVTRFLKRDCESALFTILNRNPLCTRKPRV